MPRAVDISVPADRKPEMLERLEKRDGVAAIQVHAQASHPPPDDLVVPRGANQAAEETVRIAMDMCLLEDRGALIINAPVDLPRASGAE